MEVTFPRHHCRHTQRGGLPCTRDAVAAARSSAALAAAAEAARATVYARSTHLAKTFEGEPGMAPRTLHREARNKPQLNLDTRDIDGAQVQWACSHSRKGRQSVLAEGHKARGAAPTW
jgi:hypothetical protein